MRKRLKRLVPVFLCFVFAMFLIGFVDKKIDINNTESEIEAMHQQIREQKLKSGELEDILANEDDFYRNLADKFGYGYPNEKVYQDITGY